MSDRSDVFTPETVLVAVATELNVDPEELSIDDMADRFSIVSGEERNHHTVVSHAKNIRVCVHRNKASAELLCRTLVGDWLARGRFFDEMLPSRELLDAVVKSCNLDDLRPWLTALSREGWVVAGHAPNGSQVLTVDGIKKERVKLLDVYLKDPLNAVLLSQEGSLDDVIAVLLEQCFFDVKTMVDAIVESQGGWEGFTLGMVAMTPEGFLIEAENDYTADYMVHLFDSQQDRDPSLRK